MRIISHDVVVRFIRNGNIHYRRLTVAGPFAELAVIAASREIPGCTVVEVSPYTVVDAARDAWRRIIDAQVKAMAVAA